MNASVCVDANVAAKWVLPEEYRDQALALYENCQRDRIAVLAPPHLPIEVTNTIRRRIARGLITHDEGLSRPSRHSPCAWPFPPISTWKLLISPTSSIVQRPTTATMLSWPGFWTASCGRLMRTCSMPWEASCPTSDGLLNTSWTRRGYS